MSLPPIGDRRVWWRGRRVEPVETSSRCLSSFFWGGGGWGKVRGTPANPAGAGVEGLFESMLAEVFS